MLLLGWGAAQTQPIFLSTLFCWQLSLGSCAGRWSGPQSSGKLTKEGAGKGEGEEGRDVHEIDFCSPCFHKLAHQQSSISQTYDVNGTRQSNPIPLLHLSHYLMYFLCVFLFLSPTEMHSPNIFILTSLAALL